MFRHLTLAAAVLAIATLPAKAQDTLTIYTYESFTSEWGPGPQVKTAFEAQCKCTVDFVSVADGVALLSRLKLEGDNTKADIVLGLDTNLVTEAQATGQFAPHGIDTAAVSVPGGFVSESFIPYDYGYFAVVYDSETLTAPPTSLKELVEGDPAQKIVIQDPRTSTPGLGLLLWIKDVYGDDAPAAWARMSKRILTVTPGWSEAYGLFTAGEAPMVLSYTTSPAYHLIVENTDRYKAAAFSEGHYLQIEVAAITRHGKANPLSAQFLAFMTSPGFQDIIPETNWMLPAAKTGKPLNPVFATLVQPGKALLLDSETVAQNRVDWVDEWLDALGR
jgi:thiamine transport system substrate-binding protein